MAGPGVISLPLSLLGFLTLLHSSCYENSSQLVYTLVLKRTSSYFTLHPELYTVAPCFESAPLRDKWLLISRKKRNTDEENARDLTEWVGRAGPTGDDTVVRHWVRIGLVSCHAWTYCRSPRSLDRLRAVLTRSSDAPVARLLPRETFLLTDWGRHRRQQPEEYSVRTLPYASTVIDSTMRSIDALRARSHTAVRLYIEADTHDRRRRSLALLVSDVLPAMRASAVRQRIVTVEEPTLIG